MNPYSETGAEPARPRFDRLVASRRPGTLGRSSRPAIVSLCAHGVLVAAIGYASVRTPELASREQEVISFTEIAPHPEEKRPAAEKPEPPAPRVETPPPPVGTQPLTPPLEPPVTIPEVDPGEPAVKVEDFSGLGVVGGVADGVEGGTGSEPAPAEDAAAFAFDAAVLDVQPELRNGAQVGPLLQRLYPPLLRDAEVGGVVTMRFVIEPDGTVDPASVRTVDSPHAALSAASVQAVAHLRFRPGRYRGEYVRVVIQMPISWLPPK